MQCAWPITLKTSGKTVGCGRCMPCRINRRRSWELRLVLEAMVHDQDGLFLTLTYSPETVPRNGTRLSLRKTDVQLFLKRLRINLHRKYGEQQIRFAVCGEYGERTQRPHYHMILWGSPEIEEDFYLETWKQGLIHIGIATLKAQRYVLGYVLKRMTSKDDERLEGREPEFFHGSRHPPLGYKGVKFLANLYKTDKGNMILEQEGDVIRCARIGGRVYPLSYYMAQTLRKMIQIPTVAADRPPPSFLQLLEQLADDEKADRLRKAREIDEKVRRRGVRNRTL